ncbi:MAG TPA: peptidoglycan DD-metalloendopeptidase family protein [Rhodanobacteraceae bacterium]
MDRNYRRAYGLGFLVALALCGCASTGEAPVEDHSVNASPRPRSATTAGPRVAAPSGTYRVQRGDTLYSIAFRHGVDYRELAEWNRIEPPYTIYPGRELRLSPATSKRATAATTQPTPPPPPAPSAQSSRPVTSTPGPFEPVVATPPPASSAASSPTVAPTPAPAAPPKSVPPEAEAANSGDVAWRWPADGQVIGAYTSGDPMRQGIDIAGEPGAAVKAAADGTVVYSGNGLIGYGELIIVKHNPAFLSAYGHNRKRLVQEGDRVKAGQTIAEMGSSGASRNELHFEIRRNGKPSNPLDYLPRR